MHEIRRQISVGSLIAVISPSSIASLCLLCLISNAPKLSFSFLISSYCIFQLDALICFEDGNSEHSVFDKTAHIAKKLQCCFRSMTLFCNLLQGFVAFLEYRDINNWFMYINCTALHQSLCQKFTKQTFSNKLRISL